MNASQYFVSHILPVLRRTSDGPPVTSPHFPHIIPRRPALARMLTWSTQDAD